MGDPGEAGEDLEVKNYIFVLKVLLKDILLLIY